MCYDPFGYPFFGVIGKFAIGGAFDVLYQSNFCDSRSLNTAKQYKRCCRVHENI